MDKETRPLARRSRVARIHLHRLSRSLARSDPMRRLVAAFIVAVVVAAPGRRTDRGEASRTI